MQVQEDITAGQEIATNPALRVKGPWVASDLGKTVFLEDSPGSGVRCGLTVGKMKWGGRFWSSSGAIPGDATGKVGKKLWVQEAGEQGAGECGSVWRIRASPQCGVSDGSRDIGPAKGGSRSLAFEGIIRWPRRHAQGLAGHEGWQVAEQ